MQSFTQWARCDQQTSQFSDIRFTIHREFTSHSSKWKRILWSGHPVLSFEDAWKNEADGKLLNEQFGFWLFSVHCGWKSIKKKSHFTTLRAETKYFSSNGSNGTILVIFKPLCKCVRNELKVGRKKVFWKEEINLICIQEHKNSPFFEAIHFFKENCWSNKSWVQWEVFFFL